MSTAGLLWCLCACGGITMPSAPTSSSVAGTWTGNVTVQGQVAQMTWILTESGSSVAGQVRIALPGGDVLLEGRLSGSFDGTTLTHTIGVAAGGLPAQPSCTGSLAGQAKFKSGAPMIMQGTYAVTSSTCDTGFTTGTFTLTGGVAAFGPSNAPK